MALFTIFSSIPILLSSIPSPLAWRWLWSPMLWRSPWVFLILPWVRCAALWPQVFVWPLSTLTLKTILRISVPFKIIYSSHPPLAPQWALQSLPEGFEGGCPGWSLAHTWTWRRSSDGKWSPATDVAWSKAPTRGRSDPVGTEFTLREMVVVFLKMIDMVGSVVVVVVMVTMESVRASLAPLQGSHLEQFQLANLLLSIETSSSPPPKSASPDPRAPSPRRVSRRPSLLSKSPSRSPSLLGLKGSVIEVGNYKCWPIVMFFFSAWKIDMVPISKCYWW